MCNSLRYSLHDSLCNCLGRLVANSHGIYSSNAGCDVAKISVMRRLSLNYCRSYLMDVDRDGNGQSLLLWYALYVQTLGTSTMIKTRIIRQISIQIRQTSK